MLLRIEAQPSGLSVSVDGLSRRTPYSSRVVLERRASVAAPTSQTDQGHRYVFVRWSDGGAAGRSLVVTTRRLPTAYYRRG